MSGAMFVIWLIVAVMLWRKVGRHLPLWGGLALMLALLAIILGKNSHKKPD